MGDTYLFPPSNFLLIVMYRVLSVVILPFIVPKHASNESVKTIHATDLFK